MKSHEPWFSEETNSNKITIYLAKDIVKTHDQLTLKEKDERIKRKEVPNIGFLYYMSSEKNEPEWLIKFFRKTGIELKDEIYNSDARALLVVSTAYNGKETFFGIPFGSGRYLMNELMIVNNFGVRTAINSISPDKISRLDKLQLGTNPKLSREQISKAANVGDFGIDVSKDILKSISGTSMFGDFGKVVTGRDSLHITVKCDIEKIKEFLVYCLDIYNSEQYKDSGFDWVDNIAEVKDKVLINALNLRLVEEINNKSNLVWIAIPEIIEWENIAGFRYKDWRSEALFDELRIDDFYSEVPPVNGVNYAQEELKAAQIYAAKADKLSSNVKKWALFSCLNAEIEYNGDCYLLNDSTWYKINTDFKTVVFDYWDQNCARSGFSYPSLRSGNENTLNKKLAAHINGVCLDAKNIHFGGGNSSIEFCDVLSRDKMFLHAKKQGGSSVLSHLFSQGLVSAELFLQDKKFRKAALNKIKDVDPRFVAPFTSASRPKASDYSIVYVIYTKGASSNNNVPFFSKVNFRSFHQRLTLYQFNLFVDFVSYS